MDKVSVALAVYNGEKFLPQQLASLQSQTIQPFELVVVDDCSTDTSLDIVKAFPLSFEKKIFSNEKNMGPVYTFKKLASLCTGEFIAFCDQDDIWLPKKIELCLSAIKKLEGNIPAIAFCDLCVMNKEGEVMYNSFMKMRSSRPENFSFWDILFGNFVTGCASIINKAMANEFSKMPTNILMYDHWAALIGYSFGKYEYIDEPLILYRAHDSNVTDKYKASFITNFINSLKHPFYLKENIQQANEFKKLYASHLSKQNLNALNRFIALSKKSFWYKRFMRDKTSLLRRFK